MHEKRRKKDKRTEETELLSCFFCCREKPIKDFDQSTLNSLLNRYVCKQCVEWQKLPSATKSSRYARVRVVLHYGGYICVDCGCTIEEALVLHHVHFNGRQRRIATIGEKYKNNVPYYFRWLIKHDYPPEDEMVVLCKNCHTVRHSKKK